MPKVIQELKIKSKSGILNVKNEKYLQLNI